MKDNLPNESIPQMDSRIQEVAGKTYVEGVDGKGKEKSFNANHKTSRYSYLKHNVGASSSLPEYKSDSSKSFGKGGVFGAVLTTAGMAINDIAHGRDWNHTLKETGDSLYTSIQQEGIMGTSEAMEELLEHIKMEKK